MSAELIAGLVVLGFGAVLTLIAYLSKQKINSLEMPLKDLSERVRINEQRITKLEGKLWSEDKLNITVQSAVDKAFLRWENKMLKAGYFGKHEG